MVISFISLELRNICEDSELANEKLGSKLAAKLHARLFDLVSATSIYDISWASLNQLDNNTCELEIKDEIKIQFCCNHSKAPTDDSGLLDWNKIFRIKIINITNI